MARGLEIIIILAIVILVFTQIILPCFSEFKFFWLFRKEKEKDSEDLKKEFSTLTELDMEVEEVRRRAKDTKQKVEKVEQQIIDIKNKSNF
jgi:hypothetical protein